MFTLFFPLSFSSFFFLLFLDKDFFFTITTRRYYVGDLYVPGDSRFTVLPGINNKKLAKCLNAWSLILHTDVEEKPSRTADLSHNSAI